MLKAPIGQLGASADPLLLLLYLVGLGERVLRAPVGVAALLPIATSYKLHRCFKQRIILRIPFKTS